jgi:hypothetical protein
MQDKKFNPPVGKLLSCSPNGTYGFISTQLLQRMVEECLSEIDQESNGEIKCSKLMPMANQCYKNGFRYMALDLYRRIIKIAKQDLYSYNVFRCQRFAYEAAEKIDAIWKVVAPHEQRKSEYAKMVYFYMSSYDDYAYTILNIDNIERFERIQRYGRKHNLIDDDTVY